MDEWQSVGVSKKRRTGEALLHMLNNLNLWGTNGVPQTRTTC